MRRGVAIAEQQWPEMADAAMEVALDYFVDEEFAAKQSSGRCHQSRTADNLAPPS